MNPRQRPVAPAAQDAFALAAARLAAQRPMRDARLQQAVAAIHAKQLPLARQLLDAHLRAHAEDADALGLLARIAVLAGQADEAISLLARSLASAPEFMAARYNLATLLFQAHRHAESLREIDLLLEHDAANPLFVQLKANVLSSIGDGEQALALCEALATQHPQRIESLIRCGHARRAAGRNDACIAAYRQAIAVRPSCGPAWWSLANLKTFRFDAADVATMQAQRRRADLPPSDRIALTFALAKALEDRGDYEHAFALYAEANATLRQRIEYDPGTLACGVARNKELFTKDFLARRVGIGCTAPDPIFIVGRPRSGSTLVEQILASHSAIEGAGELPYVGTLAAGLHRGPGPTYGPGYLDVLAGLAPTELAALGERYLRLAEVHRRLGRPHFVDKRPANFSHVGMIHLMLPNARIIDVRRYPAACCMSMFKSYSEKARLTLPELGRFHRDYVALMDHFDGVLPGRVHRLNYEDLVNDPETEIRRLLDHLGLPFEPGCLRFHETARTVITPSSEQVRRPITADAIDQWRHFEPWLGPLLESLAQQ